jgi:hypothetical protein
VHIAQDAWQADEDKETHPMLLPELNLSHSELLQSFTSSHDINVGYESFLIDTFIAK